MSDEVEVEYKQAGITPFWKKLPFFFLFPFRVGPLVFMACIIVASGAAGYALGNFGLVIRGSLVYLGLRYAFNVLELFAQGRFEGHSVDHNLWGREKRPAKLGLLIVLYLVIGISIGNLQVERRVANNTAVQEQLIDLYKKDHAVEIAAYEREQAEYNARYRAASREEDASAEGGGESRGEDAAASEQAGDKDAKRAAADNPYAASPYPDGMTRESIIAQYKPTPSNPLWFKLLPAWYWIVMLLLSLMLPASAIVIALEDKFLKSLNPAHIVFLVKSMGGTYFILWALFLLIAGARQLALTAGTSLPMVLRFPLEMGMSTYLGLVLFAMMGYALYQYHQELSLDVKVDFDSHRKAGGVEAIAKAGSAGAAIRAVEPSDPLERKVQALLEQGKVDEAIAEVKDNMRYERFNPDLNARLHDLYVKKGDPALTLAHGVQWLAALVRAERANAAYDALRALQAIDPAFALEDGDAVLPIAKVAVQKRDFALAIQIMRDFDKRFPKHKDTAGLLFLNAKIASEHLRKHDKAVKSLRSVLKHFPEDAIAAEARTYLTVLEKVLAQAPAPVSKTG